MTNRHLAHTRWRISSHSNNGAGCVELSIGDHLAAVRDSKHSAGPALTFQRAAFTEFLTIATQAAHHHM